MKSLRHTYFRVGFNYIQIVGFNNIQSISFSFRLYSSKFYRQY